MSPTDDFTTLLLLSRSFRSDESGECLLEHRCSVAPFCYAPSPAVTSATRASSFCSTCSFFDRARPADALALERLLNQGINYSDIAAQFLWESVADPQVGGAGRTDPDPTILTRPDERFEGQIKG